MESRPLCAFVSTHLYISPDTHCQAYLNTDVTYLGSTFHEISTYMWDNKNADYESNKTGKYTNIEEEEEGTANCAVEHRRERALRQSGRLFLYSPLQVEIGPFTLSPILAFTHFKIHSGDLQLELACFALKLHCKSKNCYIINNSYLALSF